MLVNKPENFSRTSQIINHSGSTHANNCHFVLKSKSVQVELMEPVYSTHLATCKIYFPKCFAKGCSNSEVQQISLCLLQSVGFMLSISLKLLSVSCCSGQVIGSTICSPFLHFSWTSDSKLSSYSWKISLH